MGRRTKYDWDYIVHLRKSGMAVSQIIKKLQEEGKLCPPNVQQFYNRFKQEKDISRPKRKIVTPTPTSTATPVALIVDDQMHGPNKHAVRQAAADFCNNYIHDGPAEIVGVSLPHVNVQWTMDYFGNLQLCHSSGFPYFIFYENKPESQDAVRDTIHGLPCKYQEHSELREKDILSFGWLLPNEGVSIFDIDLMCTARPDLMQRVAQLIIPKLRQPAYIYIANSLRGVSIEQTDQYHRMLIDSINMYFGMKNVRYLIHGNYADRQAMFATSIVVL